MLAWIVPALLLALPVQVPCALGCTIDGSGVTGFVPPVLVVPSGATVTWAPLDQIGHVNVESALAESGSSCMHAFFGGADGTLAQVTFTVAGGQLFATAGGATAPCTTAQVVGGAAVLTYMCKIHPLTMKGILVVVAA